ncbi:hypothetical protein GLOTRDRAFT_139932 [Gloeophyllum trabeum ATCC 11539]|uniref:Uncharacterized protein n=1 Tax=Gloeophyllum trabeum (strain ATCC 11539 / FP-39264 / Madison 617) TaxID=670483 RepID=S7PZR5_GLOTA|nr:uncharacterized protein GLOTRDRAFT_139932 [Gloeophyllum trabeum ATCC 11539]EPQ52948.1 hypothetical protein GLOTRDRAFT_139932 [Gloeophyllum trabeum ATCC 11539]
MTHDGDEDQAEENLSGAYLTLYRQHLNDAQSHLSGKVEESLPSSYYPPSSYWTSSEKDKFFRALSVHSRLRPDLISAEIGTKTISDVCIYLDLLECASATTEARIPRADLEAATEVSEKWITFEAEQAALLAYLEPGWYQSSLTAGRECAREEKRRELRVRKGQGKARSAQRDREGEIERRQLFNDWKEAREKEWKKRDALEFLDYPRLRVLEAMLREDEDNATEFEVQQSADEHAEQECDPEQSQTAPVTSRTPPADAGISDEVIDPVLLAESGLKPSAPRAAELHQVAAMAEPAASQSQVASSSQILFPQVPSGMPFPHQDSEGSPNEFGPGISPKVDTEGLDAEMKDITTLSPRSRRQHQKRLYMRRKRAMISGANIIEHVGKLKPGRKTHSVVPRVRKATTEAAAEQVGRGERAMDLDVDVTPESVVAVIQDTPGAESEGADKEAQLRKRKISGKTLPYRFKAELEELGVDTAFLRDNHMSLFHPAGFGRLMRLYGSLQPDDENSTVAIAGSTIQFFHSHLVHFVEEAVQRAIVSREQELQMKLHTKVWRVSDDQVVPRNVAHALEMMGVRDTDKHSVFERLSDRYGCVSDAKARATENFKKKVAARNAQDKAFNRTASHNSAAECDGRSTDGEDSQFRDPALGQSALSSIPLHRDIYAPVVRLSAAPSDILPGPSRTTRQPHASRTISDYADMDSLMPAETEEEALLAELLEEDELDQEDCALDTRNEEDLWALISARETPTTTSKSRYKSKAYIDDSD